MNLQNQPPVFVPHEYWAEMEKLSKAALMDMVWDVLAARYGEHNHEPIMRDFRLAAEIVLSHRAQAKTRTASPARNQAPQR